MWWASMPIVVLDQRATRALTHHRCCRPSDWCNFTIGTSIIMVSRSSIILDEVVVESADGDDGCLRAFAWRATATPH